jgi:WD40 repeat protein
MLATGTADGRIRLYRVPKAEEYAAVTDQAYGPVPIGDFKQSETPIHSVEFSSDGKRLLSIGLEERSVYLWDAVNKKALHRFEGKGGAISPDGARVVSCGLQQTEAQMILWDAASGKPLNRFRTAENDFVGIPKFTPKGDGIVGVTVLKKVCFWNIKK